MDQIFLSQVELKMKTLWQQRTLRLGLAPGLDFYGLYFKLEVLLETSE